MRSFAAAHSGDSDISIHHQIVAVGSQSVNDSAENSIEKCASPIAADSHITLLFVLDIPNTHRLAGTLQINRILLSRYELRPIAHLSCEVGRKGKVGHDVCLSLHGVSSRRIVRWT